MAHALFYDTVPLSSESSVYRRTVDILRIMSPAPHLLGLYNPQNGPFSKGGGAERAIRDQILSPPPFFHAFLPLELGSRVRLQKATWWWRGVNVTLQACVELFSKVTFNAWGGGGGAEEK